MNRIGTGYDVHPFADGRPMVLGGVTIPHARGLDGHSDADVLAHAIADALLGAAGQPDIGHLFPNSDPSIRGIASTRILEKVAEILRELGFFVANIDSTLIAEAPKIAPHLPAMRAALARALGVSADQIGIKATTNERLGFVGREEGIAAMAVAMIEKRQPARRP